MDSLSDQIQDSPQKQISKPPVVRGARACTVCRTAKMKCVGAEDGQKPCQRCSRANVECVFEKHRRGRKPGSKLSEASKMLRRLEKGLNSAKLKSQSSETTRTSPYPLPDSRGTSQNPQYSSALLRPPVDHYSSPTNTHFPSNELPPLNLPYQSGHEYAASSAESRSMEMDEDDEDCDRTDESLFPAKLIRKENQRNSFFQTILNPKHEAPCTTSCSSTRGESFPPPPLTTPTASGGHNDPISAGLIDEEQAKVLFDLFFLRLNPFANLFDPALHSVSYVRSKCPFLFTTIIMAATKFFQPELFKACQKMANDLCGRAFVESWKRIEVVQAIACLTYWKEPDDNRTWYYIGCACRMAVELGLNRFVSHPPPHETEFQMRERRNRERTYLVLFVHDRSLSTQTGRHWMLPEDDIIKHSTNWHKEGGPSVRPEDVVVSAFVQLRRLAAETTEMFQSHKAASINQHDVNYDVVLRSCNNKLAQWMETWNREMQHAAGQSFHFSFLNFFRLHVRLFLNSYGIQSCMSPTSRASPSLQSLSACCTSALESLTIASKEFASMSMLRYGQDSITVMTAYSAVFLLKLLRSSNILAQLEDGTPQEIHTLISRTADAYHDASAAYHARFLRSLVANDIFKTRWSDSAERYDGMQVDPRLQGPSTSSAHSSSRSPSGRYGPTGGGGAVAVVHPHDQVPSHSQTHVQSQSQVFQFPASPNLPAHPTLQPPSPIGGNGEFTGAAGVVGNSSGAGYSPGPPPPYPGNGGGGSIVGNVGGSSAYPTIAQHASELDAHYWRNMFLELGFGRGEESAPVSAVGTGVGVGAAGGGEEIRSPGGSTSYHGGPVPSQGSQQQQQQQQPHPAHHQHPQHSQQQQQQQQQHLTQSHHHHHHHHHHPSQGPSQNHISGHAHGNGNGNGHGHGGPPQLAYQHHHHQQQHQQQQHLHQQMHPSTSVQGTVVGYGH